MLVRGKVPRVIGLAEALREWLDHRRDVLLRRSNHRLAQIAHRLEVLGSYLVAYLNLDQVIRIIRREDEPKPVLISTFSLTDAQADAILNMRLRNLRRLEEMEIRTEDKALRAEERLLRALVRSEAKQWSKVADEIKEVRAAFDQRPRSASGAPASPKPPPMTRRRSRKRWPGASRSRSWSRDKGSIRALKGAVTDFSGVVSEADDRLKIAFPAETTSKILVLATNGRFYTLEAGKLPGGRGHGEPVRLFIDLEQDADLVAAFPYAGGRKFLVASRAGRGFVVPEDECLANTRKGKQVLNVTAPDEARALTSVDGDFVAVIGENRKLVVFGLDQVPDMGRGRGVRLQRYKDGGLSDVTTFKAADGLTWTDAAGRVFTLALKELSDWRANRADAGRIAPKGFPRTNQFSPARQRRKWTQSGDSEA